MSPLPAQIGPVPVAHQAADPVEGRNVATPAATAF